MTLIIPANAPSVYKGIPDRMESLVNTNNVGMANNWTVSVWMSPEEASLISRTMFSTVRSDGATPSSVLFVSFVELFGLQFTFIRLWSNTGVEFKLYAYQEIWEYDTWYHAVLTWNGTSLLFYQNGVFVTPTSTPTDGAGTQSDFSRSVALGSVSTTGSSDDGSLPGIYNSCGVWNTALSASEIAAIYSGGYGYKLDLNQPYGNYAKHGALCHLWRPGRDPSNIGRDWCSTGNEPLINLDMVGITTADIWSAAPKQALGD